MHSAFSTSSPPAPNSMEVRHVSRRGSSLRLAAAFLILGGLTVLALYELPTAASAGDVLPVLALGILLVTLTLLSLGAHRARALHPRQAAFVMWWFLVCSQGFFLWETSEGSLLRGSFPLQAYAEATTWALVFALLVIVTLGRPQYLERLFAGANKWLSLYALACLASVVYSPQPMFSLAWALRLGLVALVLQMVASLIVNLDDATTFFRVTLWGFAFLTFESLIIAFTDPTAFAEGRLGGYLAPDEQSAIAGTFVLLWLWHYTAHRRRWMIPLGLAGMALMILSGGKSAIVAATFCGVVFFLMQKRAGAALGLFSGIAGLGVVLLLATPLSKYFLSYLASGSLTSLTGRTSIWSGTLNVIFQRPVLGHGYVSSRFLFEMVRGPLQWANTHNAFLEAWFNNGLIGLALILAMHAVILSNLWKVLRMTPSRSRVYLLATGCAVIYLNVLINGMVTASCFGGRTRALFVIFLALVAFSGRLLHLARQETFRSMLSESRESAPLSLTR